MNNTKTTKLRKAITRLSVVVGASGDRTLFTNDIQTLKAYWCLDKSDCSGTEAKPEHYLKVTERIGAIQDGFKRASEADSVDEQIQIVQEITGLSGRSIGLSAGLADSTIDRFLKRKSLERPHYWNRKSLTVKNCMGSYIQNVLKTIETIEEEILHEKNL